MTYLFRLIKNAIIYLIKYGPRFFISKTKEVVLRKFKKAEVIDENLLYTKWIQKYEPEIKVNKQNAFANISKFKYKPLISILIPFYNAPKEYFELALNSIRNQYYDHWEICIVDDASPLKYTKPYLTELSKDPKIKVNFSSQNNHISVTTNKCFNISSGEYVLLMDNDDEIAEDTLYELVKLINEKPTADLIYFDEDKLDQRGNRTEPWFKPDFSPELMRSMMFPTHALYSRSIYKNVGMLQKGYEGSQDYDLALRVMDLTKEIYHIPKVLYHWRKIPGSTAEMTDSKPYVITSAKRALLDSLHRKKLTGTIKGENYPFKSDIDIVGKPSVEIIIPTKDQYKITKIAISSIIKKSTYSNYTITLIDNGSTNKKSTNYFSRIEKRPNINVIKKPIPYNFSALNNYAVSVSTADYLLFLNNDTKIITPNWIEELLMWAQQKDIGAVGTKLLFPDNSVQHAGILLGMGEKVLKVYKNDLPIGNHAFYKEHTSSQRYFNHLNLVKNYSAVTAACLMVKRSKFNEVKGFNEKDLGVAFNDVDLCLKLNEKGYRTVYTPYATTYHLESASRNPKPSIMESRYINKKWRKYLENDPYLNGNFEKETMTSFILPK